jgi:hypothetical protein
LGTQWKGLINLQIRQRLPLERDFEILYSAWGKRGEGGALFVSAAIWFYVVSLFPPLFFFIGRHYRKSRHALQPQLFNRSND